MTRYVLTLEPKPGVDDTRALRAALKALGRRFGLRCVEIRQIGAMDGCKHPECQEAALIARKRAPVRKTEPQAVSHSRQATKRASGLPRATAGHTTASGHIDDRPQVS